MRYVVWPTVPRGYCPQLQEAICGRARSTGASRLSCFAQQYFLLTTAIATGTALALPDGASGRHVVNDKQYSISIHRSPKYPRP